MNQLHTNSRTEVNVTITLIWLTARTSWATMALKPYTTGSKPRIRWTAVARVNIKIPGLELLVL